VVFCYHPFQSGDDVPNMWQLQQIAILEETILEGFGLHDHYRDMRLDVDNMSYEVYSYGY
jgi:hypothetical protein